MSLSKQQPVSALPRFRQVGRLGLHHFRICRAIDYETLTNYERSRSGVGGMKLVDHKRQRMPWRFAGQYQSGAPNRQQ